VAKRSFEDLDEERDRALNELRYRALNELEAAKAQRLEDAQRRIGELEEDVRRRSKAYNELDEKLETFAAALRKYLDNHCANADAQGMSALCECKLCLTTRALLQPSVIDPLQVDPAIRLDVAAARHEE
jgi:phage-related tail protein